jgi:hypothetical protein
MFLNGLINVKKSLGLQRELMEKRAYMLFLLKDICHIGLTNTVTA